MSSRNPFSIGRIATNKVNTVKLDNRIAYQFRSGIINESIPNYESFVNETPPENTGGFVPLPDKSLTTIYFEDAAITSKKIAKHAGFPTNTIIVNDQIFDDQPATIQHVREYMVRGLEELNYEERIEELLGTFSDDITQLSVDVIPLDASVSIIDEADRITSDRISDETITGDKYDASYALPSNLELGSTNNNIGNNVATTEYVATQYSLFVEDASLSSVGKLANAILNMTDASFLSYASEKENAISFDSSYGEVNTRQNMFNPRFSSLFSVGETQQNQYTQLKTEIDSSLNFLYLRDISLGGIVSGDVVEPPISNCILKYGFTDSSFSTLKTHVDDEFAAILSDGWVNSDRFASTLEIPSETTLSSGPILDGSISELVATNQYVKSKLQQELIGNPSVIQTYQTLLSVIGGDSSFAYTIVSNLGQYDSSVALLDEKATELKNGGETGLKEKATFYENLERNDRLQDISVNLFSTAGMKENTDACLNYLDEKNHATVATYISKTGLFDSSMTEILFRETESIEQLENIESREDASFSILGGLLETYKTKLVNADISLNILLDNRENNVETDIATNSNLYQERYIGVDISLVSLEGSVDSSYAVLETYLNVADTSLVIIDTNLVDLSVNKIPGATMNFDSSLVFLRENQIQKKDSTEILEIRVDTSLNDLVLKTDILQPQIGDISSDVNTNINNRHGILSNYFTENGTEYLTNINQLDSSLNSREISWDMARGIVDASFQLYNSTYNNVYRDAIEREVYLGLYDASTNMEIQRQNTQLNAIDASMLAVTEDKDQQIHIMNTGLMRADQSLNQLDYSVLDYGANYCVERKAIQDASISLIQSGGWVDGTRLYNLVLPNSTSIGTEDSTVDMSGTQIASVGFFKKQVDDLVGMPVSPFIHLTSFAFALNNTGNYTILVEGYLNEIGSQLNTINSGLSLLTSNTGGDFNYDASLLYLDGKMETLDTSNNTIQYIVDTRDSLLDTSFSWIISKNMAVDASLVSLSSRDGEMAAIFGRQTGAFAILDEDAVAVDASRVVLDYKNILAKTGVAGLIFDISSVRVGLLGNLSESFHARFPMVDASYLVLGGKYQTILNNTRIIGVDSSFAEISGRRIAIGDGIHAYLRDSIESSTYQNSFVMVETRLLERDVSLNRVLLNYDTSFGDFQENTRENTIVGLFSQFEKIELDRGEVVQKNGTNGGNVSMIDSSGWVVGNRLNNELILPSGVCISTLNIDVATAADVKTEINGFVSNAPSMLNTLNEIAGTLNNDPNLSLTLQMRLDATNSSLDVMDLSLNTNIATQTSNYGAIVSDVNSTVYPTVEVNMPIMYRRIYSNDVSTNLVSSNLNAVNTKVEGVSRRMATNDTSTNGLDMRFTVAETKIGVSDNSFGLVEQMRDTIDTHFVSNQTTRDGIHRGLITNDMSTNSLIPATPFRDASTNLLIDLLGKPTNFAVSGTTTTSITCSYSEPVLSAAMGVSTYRLTATPTYGTTTVVTGTGSVGTSSVAVTGLVSGAVYDLSLAAINTYGTPVISGVSSATVLAAPSGLTGSASTTSGFTAGWASGGGIFTKYTYSLLDSNSSVVSSGDLASNVLTRNFTGLTDGSSYVVRVRSANPYVMSSDVSMVYGTIFGAPGGFAFSPNSSTATGMTFNMNMPTKPYTTINVGYRPLGGAIVTTTSATTPIVLSGLSSGKIYDVSVNIQNLYGAGRWSSTVRGSTSLSLPASLTAGSITSAGMKINFASALATQDCSYVLRTIPPSNQYVLTAGDSSNSIAGLLPSTTYTIYLDASNGFAPTVSINTSATTDIARYDTSNVTMTTVASNSSSNIGIALDANLTRAVLVILLGKIQLSKIDASGVWGGFTIIDDTVRNYTGVALTDDGNLGVACDGFSATGYVYKFTWDSSTSKYSTLTRIGDSTPRKYCGVAMTPSGSRIVACANEGLIYFADWDSSNSTFGTFKETLNTIPAFYLGVAISRDASKIAYSDNPGNFYFATWNDASLTYTSGVKINSTIRQFARAVRFTSDAKFLWMTTFQNGTGSLWYSSWNSVTGTFSEPVNVPTTKVPANMNGWGLWINPTNNIMFWSPYGTTSIHKIVVPLL